MQTTGMKQTKTTESEVSKKYYLMFSEGLAKVTEHETDFGPLLDPNVASQLSVQFNEGNFRMPYNRGFLIKHVRAKGYPLEYTDRNQQFKEFQKQNAFLFS